MTISNAAKVLWPEAAFTKRQLVDYYAAVAAVLLPHLTSRPVTLRRFPDGIDAAGWYQYECRGAPAWMRTAEVPYRDGARRTFCLLDDARGLEWVANLATIELHPLSFRVDAPGAASYVVFDLDPGAPADIVDAAVVALRVRDRLDRDSLPAFAKTSGSLGLHVWVPLNGTTDFAGAKRYARIVAQELTAELGDRVVDRNARALRGGKVLVDWLQNDPSRSNVAPYSLRAMPWPTVSMPVTWEEVEAAASTGRPELLTFNADDVSSRLERYGDLFEPVQTLRHDLPSV